jgi:retinol dehydrogenase 13
LGSLESVREFVKEFKQRETRLDVLINNAAATGLENKISKDGIQQELQINHYGPFLLTVLLIGYYSFQYLDQNFIQRNYFADVLKKSSPSRVIMLSSMAHQFGKCELDNLNCEKSVPSGVQLYANAKLMNVMFANEFARKLEGTGW